MSNTYRILILGLALLMALALAAPALAQGPPEAQIRVAHLAFDAPNVDVSVNGEPVAALQNVPYGTISPFLPLPAGTQQVTVYPAGDSSQPVIDTPVDLAAGGAYTIGAIGLVSDGALGAQVYQDDLTLPAQGNSKLRVVHASPDAGPVDVVPAGGAPLVSGLQFPNASPYAQVPAGTYTLNVNAAGTNTTAISVPNATVASGGVYSAFAVGTAAAGNLDVILAQDSAGTEPLPDTGGISPLWLAAGLATMGVMFYASVKGGALAVRRIRAKD
ncbi:MAG TPA: DUF4397 domain-containing protein [Rubrobacteraceae bacterium]|nr:DUF4397 domain-containing protein [Rubrobacteraceae bacterium]